MAPCEVSATLSATPETIWKTCLEPMKWENWDPDLKAINDLSGGCENGSSMVFAMNDGSNIPITLSNVVKNKSVDFKGGALGGLLKAEGKIRITPVDETTSKIDYSFELLGAFGPLVALVKKKEVVEGTQGGLDNMVKMSKEAQKWLVRWLLYYVQIGPWWTTLNPQDMLMVHGSWFMVHGSCHTIICRSRWECTVCGLYTAYSTWKQRHSISYSYLRASDINAAIDTSQLDQSGGWGRESSHLGPLQIRWSCTAGSLSLHAALIILIRFWIMVRNSMLGFGLALQQLVERAPHIQHFIHLWSINTSSQKSTTIIAYLASLPLG